MFERALVELLQETAYGFGYLARLVRTPTSELSDEAQWVQLIAVQAGLEAIQHAENDGLTCL